MADTPTPANTPANPKNGSSGASFEAAKAAADSAARTSKEATRGAEAVTDAAARQTKDSARAAEAVAEKTAEASRVAAQANTEILRTQIETAQQAVRSSLEAGVRSFEGLAHNWTRAFGAGAPNPDLAEQSAQNVRAVSQASTALAKGAQDASRAWLELSQKAVRTNLEALTQLASVRTVQELVALQSNLVRDNLQQAIESGEAIARASTEAIREATRAIQPGV
jgi:hypothetical protein